MGPRKIEYGEIVQKLAHGDAEGFLRDTLRVAVFDPLIDNLLGSLRGQAVGPLLGPVVSVDRLALPEPTAAELAAQLRLSQETVARLESEKLAYQDTIAEMERRRPSVKPAEPAGAPEPVVDETPAAPEIAAAEELLSVSEISAKLGISTAMVWNYCSQGKFPAPHGKRGKAFLYRWAEVQAWAATRPSRPVAPPDPPQAHTPGEPCCINCRYSRAVANTSDRRCKKIGSEFGGKLRSPRSKCDGHKRWKALE